MDYFVLYKKQQTKNFRLAYSNLKKKYPGWG
jgi:hypothetical protein